MSATYTQPRTVIQLVPIECCDCGVVFGMTEYMQAERRQDKRWFYCPNGHQQHYTGLSDAEKLKRAEARITHLRDQNEATERSRRALKGQVTKIKRRVARGVCPCCNRTFADLAAHMETKHPEFDGEAVTT